MPQSFYYILTVLVLGENLSQKRKEIGRKLSNISLIEENFLKDSTIKLLVNYFNHWLRAKNELISFSGCQASF